MGILSFAPPGVGAEASTRETDIAGESLNIAGRVNAVFGDRLTSIQTQFPATPATSSPARRSFAVEDLERRLEEARSAGSPAAVKRHREQGKMSARERLELLLDPDSFLEVGSLVRHRMNNFNLAAKRPPGDSVIGGMGYVAQRRVCVFAQDFTVMGGSLGETAGEKIVQILDLAYRLRCPVIGINDGAGGRLQEGVVAQAIYGEIFKRNVKLSGMVPQISMIMGPCAGGAAYSPALMDFIVMVEGGSQMFLTGPDVVQSISGEGISMEDLGGARVHSERSGNTHLLVPDELAAIERVRELLSYLPSQFEQRSPVFSGWTNDTPSSSSPEENSFPDERLPLLSAGADDKDEPDVSRVLMNLLDGGRYLEIQELFGAELMTGFGRIEGQSVGFVACRRSVSDGWLSSTAATKAARFIRTCDAFNISLITVVDSFGFRLRPGEDVEEVARDGAKLVHAYAEADVPMVTLIIGNAFGEAYAMLGSKHLGADFNFAWPSARIGIAYRTPHTARDCDQDAAETRSDFEAAYAKSIKDPYLAAERGYLDAVIHPDGTRETVARSLRLLTEKTRVAPIRKHENLPL